MPQGPVQSINELQGERARAAATLSQLRASLSTGPDVDRDLASGYINVWQQHLSVIDNQIAEMQMAAAPERSAVSPNPHPPFLVPSSAYASVTPELAPPQTTHDAHLGIVESEGEASNAENNQPNEHLSLPMPDHALSTVVASQPAKCVGATECLRYSLTLPPVCRNSFKTAIETFLTLMLPFKRVSKSSDYVI